MKFVQMLLSIIYFAFTSVGLAQELDKQLLNLQLVFDASGSMAGTISGETKIAAARRAIGYVIDSLPENDVDINVGFRVFGHAGDNSKAGRALSCRSTELKVPMSGLNKWQLHAETAAYQPTGWTPISLALTAAGGDFAPGNKVRNVVVLVTDGEETCFGDPCAAAAALAHAEANVIIHVIGFNLSSGIGNALRCISKNANGLYLDAHDGDALSGALLGIIGEEVRASGHLFELANTVDTRITIPTIDLSASLAAAASAAQLSLEAGRQGLAIGRQAVDLGRDVLTQSEKLLEGLSLDDTVRSAPQEMLENDQVRSDGLRAQADDVRLQADKLRAQADKLRTQAQTLGGGGQQITCKNGENCACGPASSCDLNCPGGQCVMSCGPASSCHFACPGGHCVMSCGPASRCDFECPGGHCDTTCGRGSDCRTRCSGGHCSASGSVLK